MSEADHEATLREAISADAAAAENERAVLDTTPPVAEPAEATAPPEAGPVSPEPVLRDQELGTAARSRTPQLVASGGLVAVVLFILWRLRLRRTPPTPSERLSESAKALSAASVAAGSRAVEKLSENAGPAAERAAELAKRGVATGAGTAQRAATAARPVVAAAAARAVDNAGGLASRATDVAGDVASVAASAGQAVTSAVADVAESLGEAGHSVHKTYRKWTFRLWFSTFAAIGYVLGARAGRERYEQLKGFAGKVGSSV